MNQLFCPQADYLDLAEQLSDYTVKCLDRVRTQKELEMVLNKTGKSSVEKYESLARFKLALKFKEKKVRRDWTWEDGGVLYEKKILYEMIMIMLITMMAVVTVMGVVILSTVTTMRRRMTVVVVVVVVVKG